MQTQKRVVIDFPWVEVTFLRIILMLRQLEVRVAQRYRSTDAEPETSITRSCRRMSIRTVRQEVTYITQVSHRVSMHSVTLCRPAGPPHPQTNSLSKRSKAALQSRIESRGIPRVLCR